jgi:hypothetical protein
MLVHNLPLNPAGPSRVPRQLEQRPDPVEAEAEPHLAGLVDVRLGQGVFGSRGEPRCPICTRRMLNRQLGDWAESCGGVQRAGLDAGPSGPGIVHADPELWRTCGADGKLMMAELMRIDGIAAHRPHRLRTWTSHVITTPITAINGYAACRNPGAALVTSQYR